MERDNSPKLTIISTFTDGEMYYAVPAIAATVVSPLVRLPDIQGWMVKWALDSVVYVVGAKQLVQDAT
ncbi:hypothetical protein F5B19DRAFT_470133 [Rostrohypoxylon terebratum]|nr:hypothetical protein F5B19DRAFT_470133 [Rostrohypoxylon terebratum]